jgi:hypothetical protein
MLQTHRLFLVAAIAAITNTACAQDATSVAKKNIRTCQEFAITLEAISLKRQNAGELFFTFTIEHQANKSFVLYKPQIKTSLVDDNGDKWEPRTITIPTEHIPDTKSKATILFTRSIGGNDAKSGTVSFRFFVNGNPDNVCNANFGKVEIT